MENGSYITAPLSDIGERYADLRIIVPQAERAMERSMRHYGQMTPVVVGCEDGNTYEMVDGFKRLRAGRKKIRWCVLKPNRDNKAKWTGAPTR